MIRSFRPIKRSLLRLCRDETGPPFRCQQSRNSPVVRRRLRLIIRCQYPAVTMSFALRPTQRCRGIESHPSGSSRNAFAGYDPRGLCRRRPRLHGHSSSQTILIIAAIIAVYIVLGVLYESLAIR